MFICTHIYECITGFSTIYLYLWLFSSWVMLMFRVLPSIKYDIKCTE